ncbi:MAG: DUF4352 domain-containing protein [Micropruina sp.]|uniref:DUF4352 domain-containing protein n=1 Tax=Micropruina sp. TaxID=2737536 RepID=UPI0039E29EE2
MITTPSKTAVTLAATLTLALGLGACSGPAPEATQPVGTASTAPAETAPASAKTNTTPKIGTPVVDGDVEFVVNSVKCTTDPMKDGNYSPLDPDGQFCKVNVSATALKNIGMFLGDITITTAQIDGEVTPDVGAMMYAGALKADYIKKGQKLTGNVVFDIATDDSVATVLLKENAMSAGVAVPVN